VLNLLGSAVRGTGNMALPAAVIIGSVLGHILIAARDGGGLVESRVGHAQPLPEVMFALAS
jgi:hypothetical protein